MAGAVTGLHVFAADVGPEPLSLLDNNFSPLATAMNTLSNFSNYYVDSGAVNAIAITVNAPQVVGSYVDGLMLEIQVANTTTSATPTINVNGLGARTVVHNDLSALAIGELVATQRILVIYDATNAEFRLLSATYTAVSLTDITVNALAGNVAATINGAANQFASKILGNATSGQSLGLLIQAGTTSADQAIAVQSQGGGATFFQIFGDGHGLLGPTGTTGLSWNTSGDITITPAASTVGLTVNANSQTQCAIFNSGNSSGGYFDYQANGSATGRIGSANRVFSGLVTDFAITSVGANNLALGTNSVAIFEITSGGSVQAKGPIAAAFVDMTPDASTFTGTLTGFTATVTGTCIWSRNGNQVQLQLPVMTGTSNSTSMTLTGLPSAITPTHAPGGVCTGENNSGVALLEYTVSGTTVTFYFNNTSTGFTASGTKGISLAQNLYWNLN